MSFLLFLCYLLVVIIRPQEWIPTVYGLPLITFLSLVTAFFIFLEQFSTKRPNFVRVPQNKFMMGFFLAVLLSHIVHTYFAGMLSAFSHFVVIVILYFLMVNSTNSKWRFKVGLWSLVLMITLLVLQGIHQIQTGYGWAGQPLTVQGGVKTPLVVRINWVGIFGDPNDLALIFVVAVGILIALLFGKKWFLHTIFVIPLLGLLLYGIYLTNSRGGFLALVVTIFFFFVKRTRRFVLGGVLGGIAIVALFAIGPSRLGLISTQEASAYNRIELWYQGILMLKQNPFFGVGFNMFTNELPQTAHNSFILAAAELGLFGLYMWMGLIYASFKELSIIQKIGGTLADYAYGLQAALIGFCAAAFFLSRTYVIIPYILFALSGSLYYIVKTEDSSIPPAMTQADYYRLIPLSIGTIGLAYLVLKIGL